MKQSINFSQFCDAFKSMGREEQFSYDGKRALYDYLIEYEENTGEEVELDVIGLCCDYTEYESFEAIQEEYDNLKTIQELEDNTQVIPFNEGAFIIGNY